MKIYCMFLSDQKHIINNFKLFTNMQYLSFLCSEGRVFKNGVAGAFVGNVASSNWLKVLSN